MRAKQQRAARWRSSSGLQTRWAHRPKARVTPKHRLAVCAPSGVPLRSIRRQQAAVSMKWIAFLSGPLYALDQISKYWILHHIDAESQILIIPRWFYLVNVPNTGAAFGSFKNNNAFFIVLSCIALVAVVSLLLRRQDHKDAWRDLSLALLLAGVLGNLTDRLTHGHVIDFLLVNLHVRFADPWPAFNVADSCICIAVICFIIHTLRQKPASAAEDRSD